jgi:hypothetical protein
MLGFIYVIEMQVTDDIAQNPIKIGYSKNPGARRACLDPGSPYPLRILATIQVLTCANLKPIMVEHTLHTRCKDYRLKHEWFRGTALTQVLEWAETFTTEKLEIIFFTCGNQVLQRLKAVRTDTLPCRSYIAL